jgi:hypothetical protein
MEAKKKNRVIDERERRKQQRKSFVEPTLEKPTAW